MENLETALETARVLHRSAVRLSRRLMAARGPEGISVSKLMVLGRLHRLGPATATELAAFLRIQPQSLTRLLAALEQRGIQRPAEVVGGEVVDTTVAHDRPGVTELLRIKQR